MMKDNKALTAAQDLATTAARWNEEKGTEKAGIWNTVCMEKKRLLNAMGYTVTWETNKDGYVTSFTVDGEKVEIKYRERGLTGWIVEV